VMAPQEPVSPLPIPAPSVPPVAVTVPPLMVMAPQEPVSPLPMPAPSPPPVAVTVPPLMVMAPQEPLHRQRAQICD